MKRGRKPQGDFAGKSSVFSTRITPELRRQLERAKRRSGRSLSQEIETRLRRSFDREKRIEERIAAAFGDERSYAFFRLLDLAAKSTPAEGHRKRPRKFWLDDPYQYAQAATAIRVLLVAFEPTKGARRPKGSIDPEALGLFNASQTLADVRTADQQRLFIDPDAQVPAGMKEELEHMFDMSAELGIRAALKDLLDRAPDDLWASPRIRHELERNKP